MIWTKFPFIECWNWTFERSICLRASWHKCEIVHAFRFQRVRVFVIICLYFCMRLRKPCIQIRIEGKADTQRESNSKDSFYSFFLYYIPATHRHVEFYTHTRTRIYTLTQTTYNAISRFQWMWTLNTSLHLLLLLLFFFHFSLFFCSFFGFIRSGANSWVFKAIELTFLFYFIYQYTLIYLHILHTIPCTHTRTHNSKPSNNICVNVRKNENILLNLLLLLLLLLLVCQSNRFFYCASTDTIFSVKRFSIQAYK